MIRLSRGARDCVFVAGSLLIVGCAMEAESLLNPETTETDHPDEAPAGSPARLRNNAAKKATLLGPRAVLDFDNTDIELQCHFQSEECQIVNKSGVALSIDGYSLTNPDAHLSVANWQSIQSAGAAAGAVLGSGATTFSQVSTPSSTVLAELNSSGAGAWGSGAGWSIGRPFTGGPGTLATRIATSVFKYTTTAGAVRQAPIVEATHGVLDETFGSHGTASTLFEGLPSSGMVAALAVQADGNVLVAGQGQGIAAAPFTFAAVRFRGVDGLLDPNFGSNGKMTQLYSVNGASTKGVRVQADGTIFLAGDHLTNGGENQDVALAKYSSTGAFDATYSTPAYPRKLGVSSFGMGALAPAPSDQFVLSGRQALAPSGYTCAVLRMTAAGFADVYFGSGYVVLNLFGGACPINAVQSNGSVLVAGTAGQAPESVEQIRVARLTAVGVLDGTFGTGGMQTINLGTLWERVTGMAVRPADGSVVLVGYRKTVDDPAPNGTFAMTRLTSLGALDTAFGGPGSGGKVFDATLGPAAGVVVQADGKIVVAGSLHANGYYLRRYLADGTIDVTFGIAGTVRSVPTATSGVSSPVGVAVAPDGKIVLAGTNVTVNYLASAVRYWP